MEVLLDADTLRCFTRQHKNSGRTIALVPTMGSLHAGHAELVRRARVEADVIVLSVFVNSLQFNSRQDFDTYPRDIEADCRLAGTWGVDAVYAPDQSTMYPDGYDTTVHVDRTSAPLEGAGRPGHFDGVSTVVAKLINAAEPDVALFGQKDYQQLAVIKRMTRDLDMAVRVLGVETVREQDGLALSSRNMLLDAAGRREAPLIHMALTRAAMTLRASGSPQQAKSDFIDALSPSATARLEYVSVADAATLEELVNTRSPAVISCAVWFGNVRLIDNIVVVL